MDCEMELISCSQQEAAEVQERIIYHLVLFMSRVCVCGETADL